VLGFVGFTGGVGLVLPPPFPVPCGVGVVLELVNNYLKIPSISDILL
jgi:hypothetical protein